MSYRDLVYTQLELREKELSELQEKYFDLINCKEPKRVNYKIHFIVNAVLFIIGWIISDFLIR